MKPLDLLASALSKYESRRFVIHSDLTIFGREIHRLKGNAVSTFIHRLNSESLAVPTFNLNTNQATPIDFSTLDSSMGAFPSEAMKLLKKNRSGIRLPNPIHSYALFPSNKNLQEVDCAKSFGAGSIFDYFLKENYCWVSFGTDVNTGFTIFHHFEQLMQVPYRQETFFDRTIIKDEIKTKVRFQYFARKNNDFRPNFDNATQVLVQEGALAIIEVGQKHIYTGLVSDIARVVLKKLRDDPLFLVAKNDR